MRCILCGTTIPDELIFLRETGKTVPREVCRDCASPEATKRKARKLRTPNRASRNAYDLAGAILRGCLSTYRVMYRKAYTEFIEMIGKTNGVDVQAFLKYHHSLRCTYFYALSMGRMNDLMSYVRLDERKALSGCAKAAAQRIEEILKEKTSDDSRIKNTNRTAEASEQ